nr:PR5-like receptor kinase [Ziziphus jujuba var. spinosa]
MKFIFILPFIMVVHAMSTNCNRSCRSGDRVSSTYPYPFGFSADCEIQLNCKSSGEVLIGEFPVKSVDLESIRVDIQRDCNRPLLTFQQLYGQRYAPTSRNGIILENCTERFPSCVMPGIQVPPDFDFMNCSSNSNISCYSEDKSLAFIDFDNVKRKRCDYLLSSISSDSLKMEARVVELAWWLDGDCEQLCDRNAKCTNVQPPHGKPGHRCHCQEGFQGDGYKAGIGCRKAIESRNWKTKVSIGATAATIAILLACVIMCVIRSKKSSRKFFSKMTKCDKDIEGFIRSHGHLHEKKYRFSDIKQMTVSFKEKLGRGGYGDVYKGKLPDGSLVAVKLLNESKGNGEEFINEVASISRTSHINVVTLVGFCLEGSKRALVYEFMPNGSLEKFIYNENPLQTTPQLEWEKLLQIAKGIAEGLQYLHHGCNTRILHFDIKPHNILLDEDFCPKISDFGLAKLCKRKESIISMADPRGTIGYIAPEVFNRNFGGVSHKSDVYSYGMMILEMVGGRKNIKVGVSNTSEIYFPQWIYKHLELGRDLGLLHGVVTAEEDQIARKMILVGLWCIQTNPSDRPPMKKVIEMLEGSSEAMQIPPKPFLSPPKSPEESSSTT